MGGAPDRPLFLVKALLVFLGRSARAFYAAAVVFISSSSVAVVGDQGFSDLNTYQWLVIAGGTLTAFGGVWGFVNPK